MSRTLVAILVVILSAITVSAQFQLTVSGGYGSGKYRGSARYVYAWAAANPPNMVFDKWTGDTHLLLDVNSWRTRVSLKQKNISLTATYKSAPAWTTSSGTINGAGYIFHFPSNLRGLVFRFHGTGGSGSTFFTKSEDRIMAADLVAAGFAVVSLDSANRVDRQWSTDQTASNPDVINLQDLINRFISQGRITSTTPIFVLGQSNGGAFTPRAAHLLKLVGNNIKGAAVFCSQGLAFADQTTVPTTWNIVQNDEVLGASGTQGAFNSYQAVIGRGIAAQINVNIPSPVYPQRFARIPGVSLSDSQLIYDSLKNNSFLDQNDYLLVNPQSSNWASVIPAAYNGFRNDINDQLNVCFTAHEFFTDHNNRVIAFFNAQLP